MTITEIKNQFPNSYQKLKEFIYNKTKELAFDINDEFFDTFLEAGIQLDPRAFIDFFDAYELFIITPYYDNEWYISINGEDDKSTLFPSRINAETQAIQNAFNILEKELS